MHHHHRVTLAFVKVMHRQAIAREETRGETEPLDQGLGLGIGHGVRSAAATGRAAWPKIAELGTGGALNSQRAQEQSIRKGRKGRKEEHMTIILGAATLDAAPPP